jgi:hypothetical protein
MTATKKTNYERITMSSNVIDIIERSQARHALEEEREMNNFHASTNGAVAPGPPDENGRSKTSIFEMEEVRVWTVAVPGNTEWSPPNDGRDRMVVTLGRIRQIPKESDSAFPARWSCIPANSDCKVANEVERTMNLMIVEFIEASHDEISQNQETKGTK